MPDNSLSALSNAAPKGWQRYATTLSSTVRLANRTVAERMQSEAKSFPWVPGADLRSRVPSLVFSISIEMPRPWPILKFCPGPELSRSWLNSNLPHSAPFPIAFGG